MSTDFKVAQLVCAILSEGGFVARIVGGAPRDLQMGLVPKDYDVATDATPKEVEELFLTTIPVGKSFGVIIVVVGGVEIEVATLRRESDGDGRRPGVVEYTKSITEDAKRRDLTINALYLDPFADRLLDSMEDPTGEALSDLKSGVIRFIGNPEDRIAEDKLRMLRAVRFAARYNFQIEPHSYVAIRHNAAEIKSVSGERIRNELLGILTTEHPSIGLGYLRKLGLDQHILPEISALVGIEQPREFHPEGDVYIHTLKVVASLRTRTSDPLVMLAGLLHDIGKPDCMTVEDRIRFKGHESRSAEMAADICDRLKMSTADKSRVVTLVGSHMRWHVFHKMKKSKRRRELSKPSAAGQMDLLHADISGGSCDFKSYEVAYHEQELMKLEPMTRVFKPSDRIITGKDLLALGMKPGILLGKVLEELEDAQLAGKITSHDTGMELARCLLSTR